MDNFFGIETVREWYSDGKNDYRITQEGYEDMVDGRYSLEIDTGRGWMKVSKL